MPGLDDNDPIYDDFYGNRDDLEVIPIPGKISPDPGKTSDLGGRRQYIPQTNQMFLLKKRNLEEKLGPNLSTVENSQQEVNCALDNPGDIAKVDFERSLPLTCYVQVESYAFQPNSPLAQAPIVPAGTTPVGGAVSICKLEYGHKGTLLDMVFDCPPGALAKATVIASAARMKVRLMPKYYPFVDAAGIRRYFMDPATFLMPMNSLNFNAINPNTFAILTPGIFNNQNSFKASGLIAEGSLSTNNELTLPRRRFYGTVSPGAAGALLVRCPVSWNATSVQLNGGRFVAAGPNETVQFIMNSITGQSYGPFPANTTIPLIEGCDSIDVFCNVANAGEVPFELVYFLG